MPLLLTEDEVRRVLPMSDLIDSMEAALRAFSGGEVVQPLRTVLALGGNRFLGVMPAFLPGAPALGTKLVSVFGSNAARGLPTHFATIALLDPETGALQALLDGRYITEARTAAVSAVSARYLARTDAADLAIIGSGVQAKSHLEALSLVRNITRVRVWSPTKEHRDTFASEAGAYAPTVIATEDAEAAVREADSIVLATASSRPVIEDSWVGAGTHVMAVGACRPDQREMDPRLVARGRVIVDSCTGAMAEAGDVVMAISEGFIGPDHIAGEIGAVVSGSVKGRTSVEEVTIFKSLGMAVEDVAAAQLAYRRAGQEGIGRTVLL